MGCFIVGKLTERSENTKIWNPLILNLELKFYGSKGSSSARRQQSMKERRHLCGKQIIQMAESQAAWKVHWTLFGHGEGEGRTMGSEMIVESLHCKLKICFEQNRKIFSFSTAVNDATTYLLICISETVPAV